MAKTVLTYGMVGGSLDAFIGAVHRRAIALNGCARLAAGCFSTDAAKNRECAEYYGLDAGRVYPDYAAMAEAEALRPDRIDFVVITTPNSTHYEIARLFLERGFHVVCEKPLCFTSAQAGELKRLAAERGRLFAVTYTYTGYAMVKLMRELVLSGAIGELIDVNAEYLQDWSIDDLAPADGGGAAKLPAWRKVPASSGSTNCTGDIGTHLEALIAYVTGRRIRRVSAVMDRYGHALDLNVHMLIELEGGCHGILSASQVCLGHTNGILLRVFGREGALEWHQQEPDYLYLTRRNGPRQRLERGAAYIPAGRAAALSHIPVGHPEGLTAAFANIYASFLAALLKTENGEPLTDAERDYPGVEEGLGGVRFIEAAVKSDAAGGAWTEV